MSIKRNVRVPDELHAKIEVTALHTRQSVSAVMIAAIERGLCDEEPTVVRFRYPPASLPPPEIDLPPKPIRTIENLQRAGILKTAAQLQAPRAVHRLMCGFCGEETIPYRPDPSLVHCKQCGRNWSKD